MKLNLIKFFLWIKDHFSFLLVVLFRLLGKDKETNPHMGSNPDSAESQNGERPNK